MFPGPIRFTDIRPMLSKQDIMAYFPLNRIFTLVRKNPLMNFTFIRLNQGYPWLFPGIVGLTFIRPIQHKQGLKGSISTIFVKTDLWWCLKIDFFSNIAIQNPIMNFISTRLKPMIPLVLPRSYRICLYSLNRANKALFPPKQFLFIRYSIGWPYIPLSANFI